MDQSELIRTIYRRINRAARRGFNCPTDSQIAGYLEHGLEQKEKSRFEAHLADCEFCLSAVGSLVRQQRLPVTVELPVHLHQKAIDIVPVKAGWRVPWKWLLVPALAGLIIMVFIRHRSPQPETLMSSAPIATVGANQSPKSIPRVPPQIPEKQYVRKSATRRADLQLLEPGPNSVRRMQAVRFRWTPIANAIYYEVRMVNSEGNVMWRGQESTPTAQLPPNLSLQPAKYFVWVTAYLNDGRTVESDARAFWIRSPG